MNAKQLFLESEVELPIWMCVTCGHIHHGSIYGQKQDDWSRLAMESAERCCGPCECGNPKERSYTVCEGCLKERDQKRRGDRLESAQEITDLIGYEGMFCDEDGDNFYSDVPEVFDDVGFSRTAPPEFLFLTKPIRPEPISIDDIYERINECSEVEDGDCRRLMNGKDELEAAIDAFNALNKDVILGWEPDYSRKVRVPQEAEE